MALTDRFSPFGLILFGALLVGLLVFAFLMNSRGSGDGGEPDPDAADGAGQVSEPAVP